MARLAQADHASAPRRVLIVVTLAERGGVVSYLSALVLGLTDAYDVVVAAHGPGPLGDAMRAAGAEYVELQHVRRPISPLRDVLGLLELIRLCRRVRPQILHANSTKAGILGRLAAWLTGVPVRLYSAHGWAFATHLGASARLYRLCERMMCPLTTMTICVSRSELQRGLRARTCMPRRTIVIPNGIPLDVPRAHGEVGGKLRIVSVGRMAAPKDFITLVHALSRVGDDVYRAELVGDGPDRGAIEREVQRLGLAAVVSLTGEREDVPGRLAGADVFVLSSRSEAMPMVVLEAMAAGLPIVATAVGGVPELVLDGETGLLVAPDDPEALAVALSRLAEDPSLRRRLGAAARARAEQHHSLDRMHRSYAEVYRSATSRSGRSASQRAGRLRDGRGRRHDGRDPLRFADGACLLAAVGNYRATMISPAAESSLRFQTISRPQEFAELSVGWDKLVRSMPRPSPFLLHGWLMQWWLHHAQEGTAKIEIAARGETLVAALPLFVRSRLGIRVASFLADDNSALADLLLAQGEDLSTGRTLVDRAKSSRFALVDVFGLPDDSRLAAVAGKALSLIQRVEAPVLNIEAGWEAVYQAKTSSKRRNLHRRSRRQLGELGELEVSLARTPDELAVALEDAFDLHALRWSGRPDGSQFATPAGRRFQRDAIRALAAIDVPRIVTLKLDGRPLAFHYYFALCGRMYVHRLAFHPDFAKYSPGLVNTLDAIEAASDEGLTRVEFLGGAERYKVQLADHLEPLYEGVGLARGALGRSLVAQRLAAVWLRRRLKRSPRLHRFYFEGLAPARRFAERVRAALPAPRDDRG